MRGDVPGSRWRRRAGFEALAWFALVQASAVVAHAQDAGPTPPTAGTTEGAAEALFRAATAAHAQGDYRSAAMSYEEAYRLAPHAAAIYNAAVAWDKLGERGRAWDDYDAALRRGDLDRHLDAAARTRIAALQRELGCVSISGPAGAVVSLAHVHDRALPTMVCLAPGAYVADIKDVGGVVTSRPFELYAGQRASVGIEAQLVVMAPPTEARRPPDPAPQRAARSDSSSGAGYWLGWTALGLGAAAGIAAIPLGVAAVRARDQFEATGETDFEAHDDAVALRTWTNVACAGAIVFGVTGVILLLTSSSKPTPGAGASPRAAMPALRF